MNENEQLQKMMLEFDFSSLPKTPHLWDMVYEYNMVAYDILFGKSDVLLSKYYKHDLIQILNTLLFSLTHQLYIQEIVKLNYGEETMEWYPNQRASLLVMIDKIEKYKEGLDK